MRSQDDPSAEQTPKQIEQYYRSAKVGDAAAIRQTHGSLLRFKITKVEGVNARLGRIYLEHPADFGGAAFHVKSGRNCYSPKGQSRLVVPTEKVLAWVSKHNGDW